MKEKRLPQIVAETSGQSQSNISNHLSCLLDCGLVKNRRQGKNIFYRLGDKKSFKAFGIALEYLRLFDNDVPIKVTVNVKTKSIEAMEIAHEIIQKIKHNAKTFQ